MTRLTLPIVLCGVVLFVLFVTRDGLTVFGDGEFYLSAAQHYERGEEMRNPVHDGTHDEYRYPSNGVFATWGPFYPVLLAWLHQVGFSYDGAGRMINALSTAGSVVCILWILQDCLLLTRALGVIVFVFHPGVIFAYTHLLTESLSLCLMLMCFALLWRLDVSWHSRYSRATQRYS